MRPNTKPAPFPFFLPPSLPPSSLTSPTNIHSFTTTKVCTIQPLKPYPL